MSSRWRSFLRARSPPRVAVGSTAAVAAALLFVLTAQSYHGPTLMPSKNLSLIKFL